jgi:site-specific DNA-methyltransferase (adenine-specific)
MMAFQEAMKSVFLEALRVAKPGAHLLAFGGTRTYHRLACAIEDAGWEIRDCVMWVYGSGFPKSHNLKGEWQGWGTALKPAWEPIIVARKPLVGTVAENVLTHGTGAINVDGCRVGADGGTSRSHQEAYGDGGRMDQGGSQPWRTGHEIVSINAGRWPANLIHDGSEEVVGLFPQANGNSNNSHADCQAGFGGRRRTMGGMGRGDSGSAARFFYCAKASKADRDEGCEGMPTIRVKMNNGNDAAGDPVSDRFTKMARNHHPTVKPTDLMRYLCRLVAPPGGVVLDPFAGSGSTGKAATLEGFRFIGIEREAEYVEIAKARIAAVDAGAGPLFA